MKPSNNSDEANEYFQLLRYLEYTLHELPMGVLYDADSADEDQCRELMQETHRLESLAKRLGIDISDFLATCRWHYERYAHYLGRQRHFGRYENYLRIHPAPTTTRANPRPPARDD